MKRHPRHVTLRERWPQRYFSGLSRSMKLQREKELLKRRSTGTFMLGKSNTFARPRTSKWTTLFHATYPGLPFKKDMISKKTGIPKSTLNTVYDRGRRAWQTGGSRPGMTANQWGVARVYKYVLVTKGKAPKAWYATKFDPDNNLRSSSYLRESHRRISNGRFRRHALIVSNRKRRSSVASCGIMSTT